MTTVVAIARDGVVHMAGDTMTNVYERPIYGVPKIIRGALPDDAGSVLLAFAGDGALPALLARKLLINDAPTIEARQSWASVVAELTTNIALAAGLSDDGRVTSSVLLGWNGYLWTLIHHQAVPHADGVAAIGSGEGPAIGCVDYGLSIGVDDLEALARSAVAIGIQRDRYSGGVVQYERLDASSS